MKQKRVRGALWLSMLVVVAFVALAAAQAAPRAVQYEAVADGLSSPRHLEFDAEGTLYVAEAGSGGETCIGEGEEQRLSRLNRHFPTRAPRSGFAPLDTP